MQTVLALLPNALDLQFLEGRAFAKEGDDEGFKLEGGEVELGDGGEKGKILGGIIGAAMDLEGGGGWLERDHTLEGQTKQAIQAD